MFHEREGEKKARRKPDSASASFSPSPSFLKGLLFQGERGGGAKIKRSNA